MLKTFAVGPYYPAGCLPASSKTRSQLAAQLIDPDRDRSN
jgi:hypothetical protein